jgi:hypothetical protein
LVFQEAERFVEAQQAIAPEDAVMVLSQQRTNEKVSEPGKLIRMIEYPEEGFFCLRTERRAFKLKRQPKYPVSGSKIDVDCIADKMNLILFRPAFIVRIL